jgi:hypothetical protein
MGADFLERATPSFKKYWDRAKVRLGTADLFTRAPSGTIRTAAADIVGNATLAIGEHLTVEPEGQELVARRGNTEVARVERPSNELMQAIKDSCGIAKGIVEQVHALAGVAEISLC